MENSNISDYAPFQKNKLSTNEMLVHIIISLLPIFVVAINMFGLEIITNFIICFCSCIVFEMVADILQNKKSDVGEFTPFITAVLLGLCMPQNAPAWLCVLASFIAIIVINKIVYKLLGCALNTASTTMLICILFFGKSLALAKNISGAQAQSYSLLQLIIGDKSGVVLQACTVAILIGICYLIVMRIIDFSLPAMALGFSFVFLLILGAFNFSFAFKNLLFGNIIFAGTFLFCDFKAQPQSFFGKLIYCFCFGLFVALLRCFSSFAEGAYLAIFIANLAVMLCEDLIIKHRYKNIKK